MPESYQLQDYLINNQLMVASQIRWRIFKIWMVLGIHLYKNCPSSNVHFLVFVVVVVLLRGRGCRVSKPLSGWALACVWRAPPPSYELLFVPNYQIQLSQHKIHGKALEVQDWSPSLLTIQKSLIYKVWKWETFPVSHCFLGSARSTVLSTSVKLGSKTQIGKCRTLKKIN